jgi:hypothetical protein
MYSAFAQRVFESVDPQIASDEIDQLIKKLRERRPSYQEFLVGFEQILFTNSLTKQRGLVRYILKNISMKRGYAYHVDWDDLTIEHIFPQEKIDSNDWKQEIVGQIGNLIFVSHDLNGRLGTKVFTQKRRILEIAGEGVPRFILEQNDWTADLVTQHTELLAEYSYNHVWKL